MRALVAGVAVVLAAGCAGNPSPVPVLASPADLSALGGSWEGEYSSSQTGRSGSIVFQLAAGRDTAFGDVLMVPKVDSRERDAAQTGSSVWPPPQLAAQLLTIRFVRVEGGEVSGTLDPYQDPECGCLLSTTFVGRLDGDRIRGTYTTYGALHNVPITGRWEARRSR